MKVHIAYGYGLFTGGLGFGSGLQLLEASVVPASGTPSLQEHLDLIEWFGAEALLCTPSCAASLARKVEMLSGDWARLWVTTLSLKVSYPQRVASSCLAEIRPERRVS